MQDYNSTVHKITDHNLFIFTYYAVETFQAHNLEVNHSHMVVRKLGYVEWQRCYVQDHHSFMWKLAEVLCGGPLIIYVESGRGDMCRTVNRLCGKWQS